MKNLIYIILGVVIIALAAFLIVGGGENYLVTERSDVLGGEVEDDIETASLEKVEDKSSLIIVESPKADEAVASPLSLSGKARGFWFFEATFPVVIVNWDGLIIGEGFVEAAPQEGGDWMTEEFVPFKGVLEFEKSENLPENLNYGYIIFRKANPSDLPENDDALEFRIQFD